MELAKLHEVFVSIVGEDNCITDSKTIATYLEDWRGKYQGTTPFVLLPNTTESISKIIKLCFDNDICVVPQGGNTSLCGANVPRSTDERMEIIMSSSKLNRVIELDADNQSLIVESGCILARIQETASENGLYFPLSLGAEGSSQIGGNISTNAGGTNVLKYGMTRGLVMGLEVVLPDGSIYSELKGLRKDNTGYDLKQFFIGAEGTLGFITKICLKLFLQPLSHTVALVAVENPKQAIKLLKKAKQSFDESLCAFELMNSVSIKCVEDQMPNFKIPLESSYPWQILIDVENVNSTSESNEAITSFLERQLKEALILDATIAINNQQRNEFWQLRHGITESKKLSSTGIDHDISVPISNIPEVIEQSRNKLEQVLGKSDFYVYGHVGDGNLHITKSKPKTMDKVSFQMKEDELTRIVHQIAVDLGGSFSGEHGIGVKLKNELEYFSDPVKMQLLKTIKKAIDPRNIMNPNKLFD